MGRGDEYSRDAYNYEFAYESDDDSDEYETDLHPEDWQDMYSQEILDAWMKIREYAESNYIKTKAGFPQFVELVLDAADQWNFNASKEPSLAHRIMWTMIKDMPIICDRVQEHNFFAWAEKYIDYN